MSGILLQIMEEGELTDSGGRKVSFKNAVVVMTSNVGGDRKGDGLGFRPAGSVQERTEALRQAFPPEFLGRLDRIVAFSPLQDHSLEKIAEKYLHQLQERMTLLGIQLILPGELAGCLASQCRGKDGARHLRRLVQDKVEGPLSEFLLRTIKKTGRIKGILRDGTVQFQ